MDVNFSLFCINIPDFLILRARTTSAPTAEVGRDVIGPNQTGNLNFLVPGLDPVNHFFDLYESIDGTALSILLGTFTFDVRNNRILNEYRFYVVGSGVNNAPADTATTIIDSYLDGKVVTGFHKRGVGPLIPSTEWGLVTGGLALIGAMTFDLNDTYAAEITYTVTDSSTVSSGMFKGIKTVTADATLDASYYDNRIKCKSTTTRLVVTMDHISNIPDGKFFYFTDQDGGAQFQTKFIVQDGNFLFNGVSYSELWIGKGESLWIEKQGAFFEVIKECAGMLNVGRRGADSLNNHPNTLPEDNSLWSADDYPRPWYWLTHAMPNNNYFILDDNLDSIGYTRPVDANGFPFKAGLFIISISKRKFRMPDTRGMSEKGMNDFSVFGTDPTRLYDYPGGFQKQASVTHKHDSLIGNIPGSPNGTGVSKSGGQYGDPRTGLTDLSGVPCDGAGTALATFGSLNIVNNFGVIYTRNV